MVALEREVCAGGWRMLCAGMMVQTVQRLEAETLRPARQVRYHSGADGGNVKEVVYQTQEARRWVEGGVGTITFEDCCDALGVDCRKARQAIEEHCRQSVRRSKRFRH